MTAADSADPLTLWTAGHLTLDDVVMWDGTTHFGCAGGAALYAAVGAALVEAGARIATRVGDGYPQEELARFEEWGITLLPTRGAERTIAQWALYERDGSRTFLLHPGSGTHRGMAPRPQDYRLTGASAVHLAPMPVAQQLEWLRSPQLTDVPVTADPHEDSCAEDPEQVLAMAALTAAFLPSEAEARVLAGPDPVEAVRTFRGAGAPVSAVKLGEQGSLVATDEGVWRVPAALTRVEDPTGAGDAYCGGFAAALAQGLDGVQAARLGTAAAAAIVEVRGTAIPSLEAARRTVRARAAKLTPVLLTPDGGGMLQHRREHRKKEEVR